jgi:hypothetical protein
VEATAERRKVATAYSRLRTVKNDNHTLRSGATGEFVKVSAFRKS